MCIVRSRLAFPLILAGLTALFFAPLVLHPTQVLYSDHSDLLAHYLPAKRFLVESWRETGELPLWCPYSLGGMPFIHDPQVGAFYPPHWFLLFLPLDAIGPALSWLIVAHLLIAGWGTYLYARSQELDRPAAFVAAVGFLFAGKWLLHLLAAGHYTTIGLAWLPWALLCLETAIARPSLSWATAAGGFYALIILGTQPQWAFYAGILLAAWPLASSLSWRRWFAYGTWAGVIALALSAVQLLPTLEAAAFSTRSGGVPSSDVLDGGLRALLFLVGPTLTEAPANLAWEDRGGFGLLWLVAAALAPVLCRGRVRWQAAICLGLILFAVGGAALVQELPGFRLFRQPTRMLLIASLPVSLLAGATTQALFRAAADWSRCRRVFVRVVAGVAILTGGFAMRQVLQGNSVVVHLYWVTLLLTLPLAFWLLKARDQVSTLHRLLWIVLLIIDLWSITWPLVAVRPEGQVYATSPSIDYLIAHRDTPARILDCDDGDAPSPLGRGAALALLQHLEPVRGYNPLDVRRYKEYLQRIAADESPLRPFEHPLTFPIVSDLPIRDKALLDLLGVRYMLKPSAAPLAPTGWCKVCDDPNPVVYDVIAGGRRALEAYTLYENKDALPRAFIVPRTVPLTSVSDLKAIDFRREVLLENLTPNGQPAATEPGYWSTSIREYRPNRIVIDVAGTDPGWLVLTDVWYPGWRCTVDDERVEVYRANTLFRAVPIALGRHEVQFQFEPESLRQGSIISLSAIGLASLVLCGGFRRRLLRGRLPFVRHSR
jgi:hypothetical protein